MSMVRFIAPEVMKRLLVNCPTTGGVLLLMMGAASEEGNPRASGPVDRQSNRIQAVAYAYPAGDLLISRRKG